jgi:hypothetical protein
LPSKEKLIITRCFTQKEQNELEASNPLGNIGEREHTRQYSHERLSGCEGKREVYERKRRAETAKEVTQQTRGKFEEERLKELCYKRTEQQERRGEKEINQLFVYKNVSLSLQYPL